MPGLPAERRKEMNENLELAFPDLIKLEKKSNGKSVIKAVNHTESVFFEAANLLREKLGDEILIEFSNEPISKGGLFTKTKKIMRYELKITLNKEL